MLERCADDHQGFSPEEKQGLYRAIFERRDVRSQFRPDPIPWRFSLGCLLQRIMPPR